MSKGADSQHEDLEGHTDCHLDKTGLQWGLGVRGSQVREGDCHLNDKKGALQEGAQDRQVEGMKATWSP